MNRAELTSSTMISLDWTSPALDEPPPVQLAVANAWQSADAADLMQNDADALNGRIVNQCRSQDQALYMKIGRLIKGMCCWCCTS